MRAIAIILWLSLVASTATAVDGVLEINQTCALQGGCLAGDSAGFPVTIGNSGSYRLTSNLLVPAETTGVVIQAEDVTLDLNGFVLRAPTDCSASACGGVTGSGIVSTFSGTRVLNGIVRGFADGGLDLGDEAVVERIEARANGRVGIGVGDRSRIQQSQASNGAGDGVQAGDHGAVLSSVSVGNQLTGVVLGVATGLGEAVVSDNGAGDVTGGAPFGNTSCSGGSCAPVCIDTDGDGAFANCAPLDCDDNEPAAAPGQSEICDGIDNNCVGGIDEGGICTAAIGFCRLQFPTDTAIALGDSQTSFGRVFAAGVTDLTSAVDPYFGLVAESGLGATGTDPNSDPSWLWTTGEANASWDDVSAGAPGIDEYQTEFTPASRGSFDTAYRFSVDSGTTWTVCDADAEGSNDGFDEPGSLEVLELCTDLANPAPECGAAEACVPNPTTSLGNVAQCLPSSGTGLEDSACTFPDECSPGLTCVFDGFTNSCQSFCQTALGGSGCSGGASCVGFSTAVFVGATEWGVCF